MGNLRGREDSALQNTSRTWNVAQPRPTFSNFGCMDRRQRLSSEIQVLTFSDGKTNPSGPASCARTIHSFKRKSVSGLKKWLDSLGEIRAPRASIYCRTTRFAMK
jgi:hypothetical protein